MRFYVGLLLFCLLSSSCDEWKTIPIETNIDSEKRNIVNETQDEEQWVQEIEVSGYYSRSFEYSGFEPCGSNEIYWTWGEEVQSAYTALHLPRREKAYARLRGKLRGPGSYGHMGSYKWAFEVVRVIEMRAKREGDCK